MYGWRARIGLISSMKNDYVETAFHSYAPEGVSFSSSKISFCGCDDVARISDQVEAAAAMYAESRCDLLVCGITAGSIADGIGWDEACAKKMESASGIPAITSGMAVLEALRALGAKKVAVMTPHSEQTNEAEKKFLEDNGFEVTNIRKMDLTTITVNGKSRLASITEHALYQNCRKMDLNGADVFLISCMELPTLEVVESLEAYTGVPVVTSQQATLWGALRHSCVGTKMPKLGKLFTL